MADGAYDISGSTSSTDAFQTSATSGFGGGSSFVGGVLNKGIQGTALLIFAGLALVAVLIFNTGKKKVGK